MKMSRRERKIYNLGRAAGRAEGYTDGYKDGLHDGNPFISLAEGINKTIGAISEKLSDPEFVEYCKQQLDAENESEEFMKTLTECDSCGAEMKGAEE